MSLTLPVIGKSGLSLASVQCRYFLVNREKLGNFIIIFILFYDESPIQAQRGLNPIPHPLHSLFFHRKGTLSPYWFFS